MSRRGGRGTKPRCLGCSLTPRTCVCATLPRLRFGTPIAIVQHADERNKPTNTGRLFARMVEGTLVLPCGMREPAFDPKPLEDPSIDWRLLFPRTDATVLAPGERAVEGRRLGFILLDGTWRQCGHMTKRLPGIAGRPSYALPPGPPSFWTVRTQHHAEGRSTFEAALDALGLVEDAAPIRTLRRAFADITARLLHLKGKLPSPEIPAAWGL